MSDAIGNHAAKDASERVTEKPGGLSQRLFLSLVPHGNDDGQARRDGGLRDTEEEAVRPQAGVVLAERREHEDRAPYAASHAKYQLFKFDRNVGPCS